MSRRAADQAAVVPGSPAQAGAGGPVIRAAGVHKVFQAPGRPPTVALSDVSLDVHAGEFVVLVGASGCGKTTLLRMMAGLERPTRGEVTLFGKPVTGPTSEGAILFQSAVLLPWRTILENVLLPVEVKGLRKADLLDRARELLSSAGLAGFEDHYPRELSGGMRQRAALCRALLLDPPLLLMDEPFGALDAITRSAMNGDLYETWQRTHKTVVFVTHDIAEAVRLGTRVVVMSPRPGRVAQVLDVVIDGQRFSERVASPRFHQYVVELEESVASATGGAGNGGRAASPP